MNKPLSRRWFMKTAALAPVAARDAAAKIGISGAGSLGLGNAGMGGRLAGAIPSSANDDHMSYLKSRMKELLSGEVDDARRQEIKSYSMMLDPDLGSLRSVSPSFARVAQIERSLARQREQEMDSIKRQISKFTGGLL